MRNFLRQKIWSHGTQLGYLGPGIQGDVRLGFSRPQFLVIWGSYDPPVPVAFQVIAKNPKTSGSCTKNGRLRVSKSSRYYSRPYLEAIFLGFRQIQSTKS